MSGKGATELVDNVVVGVKVTVMVSDLVVVVAIVSVVVVVVWLVHVIVV